MSFLNACEGPDDLLKQAQTLEADGKFDEAISKCKKIMREYSDSEEAKKARERLPMLILKQGETLIKKNMKEKAEVLFERLNDLGKFRFVTSVRLAQFALKKNVLWRAQVHAAAAKRELARIKKGSLEKLNIKKQDKDYLSSIAANLSKEINEIEDTIKRRNLLLRDDFQTLEKLIKNHPETEEGKKAKKRYLKKAIARLSNPRELGPPELYNPDPVGRILENIRTYLKDLPESQGILASEDHFREKWKEYYGEEVDNFQEYLENREKLMKIERKKLPGQIAKCRALSKKAQIIKKAKESSSCKSNPKCQKEKQKQFLRIAGEISAIHSRLFDLIANEYPEFREEFESQIKESCKIH